MAIPLDFNPLGLLRQRYAPDGYVSIERCYFDGTTFVETNFKKYNLKEFEIWCVFEATKVGSHAIYATDAFERISISFWSFTGGEVAFGGNWLNTAFKNFKNKKVCSTYRKIGTTVYYTTDNQDNVELSNVSTSMNMRCPLYIGARGGNPDRYFDGYFYEMRIFCADDNSAYNIYPIMRKSDGKVFLYESVSDTILTTVKGSLMVDP